jgi:hypothetical protein
MSGYQQLKGHRDLKVYQLAYKLATVFLLHGHPLGASILGFFQVSF